MLHAAQSIFKFIILAAFLGGCSLFDKPPNSAQKQIKQAALQRVFYAPFDQVWRAAHAVLRYPIANENPDAGYIETEYIKGVDGFIPPDRSKPPSAGIRYKIVMSFAKGKTEGRESTRMTLDKRIEVLRDFFSDPQIMESDGLEEKVLFYRLERELIIFEALKKAG